MDERVKKLIIIALIAILAVVSVTFYLYVDQKQSNVITIENRFIDVNGDGLIDYIIEAKVVINNGETNFTPSQLP